MTVPSTPAASRGPLARRSFGLAALAAATLGVALLAARPGAPIAAADEPAGAPKPTLVGGRPLFADWPAAQKPDAVIVFSGQTYGYLQPCGCSRPQIGGLERRFVLIESLKAKGWPVAGVDLGDVYPDKAALEKQGLLKYRATMTALRDMDYLGVGVGKTDLAADLFKLLAEYALQKEQRPFTLTANVVGKGGKQPIPREQMFAAGEGKRPLVEAVEVGKVGGVAVGVAGVVGKALDEENEKQKWNPILDFPSAKKGIEDARDALAKHPLKPELRVLIFQGPDKDAAKVAADFGEFQAILCQSEEGAPAPLVPQGVPNKAGGKTLIVQVGSKGQNVGVLGAFRKPGGGFDFKYQLVPLTEEFVTPGTDAEALKSNKALQALEEYAKAVKAANLLPKYPRVSHPEQIRAASLNPPVNLSYAGTDACKGCHAAEYAKWTGHPHSHAMATLENAAKRPHLRQFDGECVVCHTVGFKYKTGYVDDTKTKHLRDVGCESCHGPGSGHVADPKNKGLLEYLSPWKQAGGPKLPDAAFMKRMADTAPQDRGKEAIQPAQQLVIRRVEGMCMKCHDHEADPHFDLYKAWQKVDHTGLAPPGGWPAVAPANPAPPK